MVRAKASDKASTGLRLVAGADGSEEHGIVEVGMVDLDELHPHPENAKEHDIDGIVESMRKTGRHDLVLVNKGTHTGRPNEILSGCGTVLALALMGARRTMAAWVDVDEDTARRKMIAENALTRSRGFAPEAYAALLTKLDGDYTGTGVDESELTALLSKLEPDDDQGDDVDDEPPPSTSHSYSVIVDCRDETHQQLLISRLESEGLSCRPLS